MEKAMALIGDFYHEAEYLRQGIRNLEKEIGISIEYETNPLAIGWERLSDYKLFILAKAGTVNPKESPDIWMTRDLELKINEFVEDGGSILILHSGLADYQNAKIFRNMIKGHFIKHPEKHPDITISSTCNPYGIADGISDFHIIDEQYFVECDEKGTRVFLKGESREFGAGTAGWVHEYGKGRVCCLTPGHTAEVLSHPMMKKLLANAIKWCL